MTYYERAVEALIEQQREPSIQFLAEREMEFEVLPIRVLKGLKNGPNYKVKLPQYLIDCSHYEISLANYLLRRSKKNREIFIFESISAQEPAMIRFELASHTSSKEAALVGENLHNWTKYVLSLNRIELNDTKVKLSKKQKEASEASPTKQAVTNLEVDSRSNLDPSRVKVFLPASSPDPLERSVIQEVFKDEGEEHLEEEIY